MVWVDKMMKKYLLIIALILVLLGAPAVALASSIAGAQYWAVIQISNNGTATTNVATTVNISTTNLIDGNYLNAQANNCVMRTSSGADVPFMPSVNATSLWSLWVPAIGADSYQSDILYTANSTGGEIRYFPGDAGMTTTDNETLELGDNFTITQKGWGTTTFTDNYIDRNLVYKEDAFKTYISGNKNITSAISTRAFNFTGAPDKIERADNAALSAISPLTVELWIRTDDNTAVLQGLINKYSAGAGNREWYLGLDNGTPELVFVVFDENIAKSVGRKDTNNDVNDGEWHYIYASWDGGTTDASIEIWIDNVRVDDTDIGAAGFLGIEDLGAPLQIGTHMTDADYFIGDIDEVRISDVVRSAAERTAAWYSERFTNDANTVVLYHFDGAGATAIDSSANDLDGTITGATRIDGGTFAGVTAAGVSSANHTVKTEGHAQLLNNASFEGGDPPDDWTLVGAGATVSRSSTQVKIGTYSANLTRNGTDCTIYQSVPNYADYQGKEVTLGCWVYATVADRAVLRITDGVGVGTTSSFHTGVAGWEWITVSHTLDASATHLRATLRLHTGDTTAYFDGAMLVAGDTIPDYNLGITVDGILKDSKYVYNSSLVPDSNANWTFLQNFSMPYMEYQKIWIGGILQQHIEWEYDTTFTDLSGNDHDATPTFRTASSDADVSAELISFQPIREAKAPDFVLAEAPAFITPTGNITSTFTTTPASGDFPLAGIIKAVADATKTPAQLPLLIIACFVILTASLSVSATMRRYGSGSILIKIFLIIAVMGVFVALKNFSIDFWMIVVFAIISCALAMASKQIGWQ